MASGGGAGGAPLEYTSNLSYYNPQPQQNNNQQQQQQQQYSGAYAASQQHSGNAFGIQSQQAPGGYGFQPSNSGSYAGMNTNSMMSQGAFGSSIDSGLSSSTLSGGFGDDFDSEPPLLEELGINLSSIWSNTLAVSIPFTTIKSSSEVEEADLAGVSRLSDHQSMLLNSI